jgi:hypothetical protein
MVGQRKRLFHRLPREAMQRERLLLRRSNLACVALIRDRKFLRMTM